MILESFLKKAELFIVDLSIKAHYKNQEYTRDSNSIQKYLNYFKHTSMKLFKPITSSYTLETSNIEFISSKHFVFTVSTPFDPVPIFDQEFKNDTELHKVKIHVWPNNRKNGFERASRALLYFHGWGRDSFFIEQQYQFKLFQRVYQTDIYALELPYHHSRNPRGFSGQGFLDGDPVRTIEAFRQATIEAYFLYHYLLKYYDYHNIGAVGVSLGAHILIMLNFLLERNLFSLACLVGSPLRHNMQNLSISPNLLRSLQDKYVVKALTILDFNKIPVKHYNEKQYLFGGKFDAIISPETVIKLGKHLQCKTYIVPTGHFTFPLYLPIVTQKIAPWPKN